MSLDSAEISASGHRRVLVVVPTLNEADHVEHVLAQLGAHLPETAEVRFVVADGGSTDGTQAIVQALAIKRQDLHLLHNPKRLQGAAINLAVERYGSDCELLVRCDAHAEYPPDFIARLIESLERHEADAVVVPMDSRGESCFQRAVAWASDSAIGSGGSAHRGGRRSGFVDHGHHAAFRLSSFRRAGGYDESFSHNEDADLDCRQRAFGARIYLDANIRVQYVPRATLPALWRQYRAYGSGRSRTMRRHPTSWRVRQLAVIVHVALCLLALLLSPWLGAALLYPLAYLLALGGASAVTAWRHRSACGLLTGLAALVIHVGWALGFAEGLATIRESPWEPTTRSLRVRT